ncbi:MFS transporter [Idiomarina baltica]|uniref:Probable arabinose efflux permease, MFS-like n=1 Tax=Idiomarina baltica OS145 TaxID=314276 RepID=A0ABP2CVC4_9GAMM|nr:MFS transporter [Idiomarina baltica]EAQ32753.1 Probable arabinose efflux permease, MFS-like [Idiomarina baltica OS145]MEC8924524.1 MFS transporter [Pseudomonadota bacterium]
MSYSRSQVAIAIFAMAIGTFSIGIGEFVMMGLLPDVGADFSTSAQQTGHLISLYAFGVVIGAPLITLLGARAPRKPLIITLMLIYSASNLLSARAESFAELQLFRFISGLPHGAYGGIVCLLAAGLVKKSQRGMAVTMVMMGLTVAILVGNPLATWFGQLLDWRTVYMGVGLVALTAALLIVACVPTPKQATSTRVRTELQALKNSQVLLTLAIGSVGFGGMFAVLSYLSPTLLEATQVHKYWIPIALLIYGLGSFTGSIIGGKLTDMNMKWAIAGSLGWAIIVLAIFPFSIYSLYTILPMAFCLGTTAMLVPALQVRLMDVAGESQTLAASLNHAAFNIANGLGAFLGGLSLNSALTWQATGWVGCLLAISGLFVFIITKHHSRKSAIHISL